MHFNAHGYLEAGLHETTVADIEEYSVKGFPSSTTRPKIVEGYKKHRAALEKLPVEFEQLIDGSFTSTKNDPSDIDMVCFADAATVDALSPAQKAELQRLVLSPAATKKDFHCDAYFCPTVPQTDPNYPSCRQTRKYWLGEFGYDRHEVPKGILRTLVITVPSSAVAAPTASASPPSAAPSGPAPAP